MDILLLILYHSKFFFADKQDRSQNVKNDEGDAGKPVGEEASAANGGGGVTEL